MQGRAEVHTETHRTVTWLKAWIIVLLMLIGCAKERPLHPSYTELIKNQFYVYVLPETEVQRRQWEEIISIWGYRFHCQSNEAPNNLYVRYVDEYAQVGVDLIIGPWSDVWDWSQDTTEVPLDTTIAKEKRAVFYARTDGSTALMFEDQFGIQVQVRSRYPITETLEIVQQLEYIGPPSDMVSNPWDCRNR
jgi:hypothetical protein